MGHDSDRQIKKLRVVFPAPRVLSWMPGHVSSPSPTRPAQMMRQDDLSQMFHCAALTLSRMGAGAKIFLAADTEAVRGYARKLLGDRVIYQDCAVAHTGEHHAIKGHDAVTVKPYSTLVFSQPRAITKNGMHTVTQSWRSHKWKKESIQD